MIQTLSERDIMNFREGLVCRGGQCMCDSCLDCFRPQQQGMHSAVIDMTMTATMDAVCDETSFRICVKCVFQSDWESHMVCHQGLIASTMSIVPKMRSAIRPSRPLCRKGWQRLSEQQYILCVDARV